LIATAPGAPRSAHPTTIALTANSWATNQRIRLSRTTGIHRTMTVMETG
jgi:hypothetical protein